MVFTDYSSKNEYHSSPRGFPGITRFVKCVLFTITLRLIQLGPRAVLGSSDNNSQSGSACSWDIYPNLLERNQ